MNLQNQLDYLPSLLDGVSLVPDGLDPDVLRSEIMLTAGLLTPLYSEPEVMKAAIAQWFAARHWTFEHLLSIVQAEYSPIENYDRNESFKRIRDDNRDIEEKLSNSDTTERSVKGDLTTTNEVSAYNSSSYVDSQKSTVTDGQVITTETEYGRKTTTDDDLHGVESYEGRTHGNVGVTTNQQMIEQELSLLAEFNIYSWIAKQFTADLMLQVY